MDVINLYKFQTIITIFRTETKLPIEQNHWETECYNKFINRQHYFQFKNNNNKIYSTLQREQMRVNCIYRFPILLVYNSVITRKHQQNLKLTYIKIRSTGTDPKLKINFYQPEESTTVDNSTGSA